jgi:hypothetical protein
MKEERAKRKAVEREQARQRAVADASAKRSHAKEVRVSADSVSPAFVTDVNVITESERNHSPV